MRSEESFLYILVNIIYFYGFNMKKFWFGREIWRWRVVECFGYCDNERICEMIVWGVRLYDDIVCEFF